MFSISRIVSTIFFATGTLILGNYFGWLCALGVALVVNGAIIYVVGLKRAFGNYTPNEN